MPPLIQKYQEKQLVIALKKAYSTLNQAGMFLRNKYDNMENMATENEFDPNANNNKAKVVKIYSQ